MAHLAQQQFCREVKERFPHFFHGVRVLEVGSRIVNGSTRDDFDALVYTGIDCAPGPGVDVVCLGHEFAAEPGSFDVVCSCETFEHDPHADKTIEHMLRLLRSGGLFFMTCAGVGRNEHGTTRTGKRYGPDADFYRNVSVPQFLEWLQGSPANWQELYLRHNTEAKDLYCYGIKE